MERGPVRLIIELREATGLLLDLEAQRGRDVFALGCCGEDGGVRVFPRAVFSRLLVGHEARASQGAFGQGGGRGVHVAPALGVERAGEAGQVQGVLVSAAGRGVLALPRDAADGGEVEAELVGVADAALRDFVRAAGLDARGRRAGLARLERDLVRRDLFCVTREYPLCGSTSW